MYGLNIIYTRQSSCVTARGVPPAPPPPKVSKMFVHFLSKILSIFCPKLCPFFVQNCVQIYLGGGGTPRGAPPPVGGGTPRGAPPVWGGPPPVGGGYPWGHPPSWRGVPRGCPPSWGGYPRGRPPQLGGPPPLWTDKLKTLPSRHTPYAGGNNFTYFGQVWESKGHWVKVKWTYFHNWLNHYFYILYLGGGTPGGAPPQLEGVPPGAPPPQFRGVPPQLEGGYPWGHPPSWRGVPLGPPLGGYPRGAPQLGGYPWGRPPSWGGPPCEQTNWKHYLPVILRMRAVIISHILVKFENQKVIGSRSNERTFIIDRTITSTYL